MQSVEIRRVWGGDVMWENHGIRKLLEGLGWHLRVGAGWDEVGYGWDSVVMDGMRLSWAV